MGGDQNATLKESRPIGCIIDSLSSLGRGFLTKYRTSTRRLYEARLLARYRFTRHDIIDQSSPAHFYNCVSEYRRKVAERPCDTRCIVEGNVVTPMQINEF